MWPSIHYPHQTLEAHSPSIRESQSGLPPRALGLSPHTQEVVALAHRDRDGASRLTFDIRPRVGPRPVHLYAVLNVAADSRFSAYYHNAAAALVVDGEIIAAAQEERFTRRKYDPNFPVNAIACCLTEGGITPEEIDYVVFYDKPFLKGERLLETYLAFAPKGFRSFAA